MFYGCRESFGKLEFAMKRIKSNEEAIEHTLREVQTASLLEHRNVMRYYVPWVEDNNGLVDTN
jgi:hypothetical protein